MKKFNKESKPSWKKDGDKGDSRGKSFAPRGGSSFGARGGKPSFAVKDGVRPMMHKATCSDCGMGCEVPFKPNGKKPILCSNCFQQEGSERPKFVGKDGRGDRQMFKATCSDCGSSCEVPFRPIAGKAIRCRNCFGHEDSGKGSGISQDQFNSLNAKLDAILKALGVAAKVETVREEKAPVKPAITFDRPAEDAEPAKKAWAKKKYD